MADEDPRLGRYQLKNVRLSFASLHKPDQYNETAEPKYKASALIDPKSPEGPANIKRAKKAKAEVCAEEWKGKIPKLKQERNALVRGDDCIKSSTGMPFDGYPGMIVVKAKNVRQPTCYDRNKKLVSPDQIEAMFYNGCMVDMIVSSYAVSDPKKGGAGYFATVEAVRWRGHNDAFGGGGADPDEFDDLEDEDEDEDEFAEDDEDEDDTVDL